MRIDPTNTSGSKTFEGDYGSLLDGIYKNNAEGMASPSGMEYIYTLAGLVRHRVA